MNSWSVDSNETDFARMNMVLLDEEEIIPWEVYPVKTDRWACDVAYPQSMKEVKIEGKVFVRLKVDTAGVPFYYEIVRSTHDSFSLAVIPHLASLRFITGWYKGHWRGAEVLLPVTFSLPGNSGEGVAVKAGTCKEGININLKDTGLFEPVEYSSDARPVNLNVLLQNMNQPSNWRQLAKGRESWKMRVYVLEDGSVAHVINLTQPSDPIGEIIRKEFLGLKFEPATLNGQPVPGWTVVRIDF